MFKTITKEQAIKLTIWERKKQASDIINFLFKNIKYLQKKEIKRMFKSLYNLGSIFIELPDDDTIRIYYDGSAKLIKPRQLKLFKAA
ncbi:MAG: hypothetical protein LUH05_04050 [Candidatus Gastranaerophilales bacterium]|nr:hypothetical protein [Candidatus Gastranaerophilales bacterium]